MSGNSKKKIAFNYYGGKFQITELVTELFPQHIHFVDVFCGSMAVTLNKVPSGIDTANDINSEVINFFRVLRDQPGDLIDSLRLTPCSREEYDCSWDVDGQTDLEKARRFYVRVRQSYCGLGAQRKSKGWHLTNKKVNARFGETVSKWLNAVEKLPEIAYRLKEVQIENRDFRQLIKKIDFPGAFFFLDPPYPEECRKTTNDYKFDFTDDDHRELALILKSIKGKAMICSYDCDLMRELYGDWRMVKFDYKSSNLRKDPVEECVWMNYNPDAEKGQTDLFDEIG